MSASSPERGIARGLRERWDRFWFAEGSTLSLGLFRIGFAVALLWEVGITRNKSVFAIADDGFHLPYLSFIPLLPQDRYLAIHALQFWLIALLGVGLLRRFACGSLLLVQGWVFFADQLNFRNHPYFFLLVLLALLLAPATDSLSLGAVFRALRDGRPVGAALLGTRQPLTYQRLIQVQIAIVYVYAALHKMSAAYLGGHILSHHLSKSLPRQAESLLALPPEAVDRLRALVADPGNLAAVSVASVALELLLPFALFHRRLRPWALAVGIPFHVGIAATMDIWTFSLAMIVSYVLFLDPETVPRLWSRGRNGAAVERKGRRARTRG